MTQIDFHHISALFAAVSAYIQSSAGQTSLQSTPTESPVSDQKCQLPSACHSITTFSFKPPPPYQSTAVKYAKYRNKSNLVSAFRTVGQRKDCSQALRAASFTGRHVHSRVYKRQQVIRVIKIHKVKKGCSRKPQHGQSLVSNSIVRRRLGRASQNHPTRPLQSPLAHSIKNLIKECEVLNQQSSHQPRPWREKVVQQSTQDNAAGDDEPDVPDTQNPEESEENPANRIVAWECHKSDCGAGNDVIRTFGTINHREQCLNCAHRRCKRCFYLNSSSQRLSHCDGQREGRYRRDAIQGGGNSGWD